MHFEVIFWKKNFSEKEKKSVKKNFKKSFKKLLALKEENFLTSIVFWSVFWGKISWKKKKKFFRQKTLKKRFNASKKISFTRKKTYSNSHYMKVFVEIFCLISTFLSLNLHYVSYYERGFRHKEACGSLKMPNPIL